MDGIRREKKKGVRGRMLAFLLCLAMLCGQLGSTVSTFAMAAESASESDPAIESTTVAEQQPGGEAKTGTSDVSSLDTVMSVDNSNIAVGNLGSQTGAATEMESVQSEGETTQQVLNETDTQDMSDESSETQEEINTAKPEFTFSTDLDGVKIHIHAADGILPDGATAKVSKLPEDILKTASQSIQNWSADKNLVQLIGFEISFFNADGTKLHQFDQKIEITYSELTITDNAEKIQVLHADANGNITETLTGAMAVSSEVKFSSNQFSPILVAAYGSGENVEQDSAVQADNYEAIVNALDAQADSTENANETVTVTFVVENGNYTNDTGSGNTHLTVKTPVEGGELTYTSWAGRYKVTGTGTVTSYTIPAGTSLSENDLSLPGLTVENIGNTNTYTYNSLISWITASGEVYSKYTVLNEDTTLYLSLYETGENYSLDYVCCADENSSISYYLTRSTTFKLGQSVAADAIPTCDEVVASGFTSATHDISTFAGWKLKVTDTGELVDFQAGMPLTAEYLEESYGNTIKAYAVWDDEEQQPEEKYCNIVLHDILLDGSEADIAFDLSVESGTTLSEAFDGADAVLEDGKEPADCVWYSVAEDGTKTRTDLSSAVTTDMELYTYAYQVILTFNPESPNAGIMTTSLVEIGTNENSNLTLTITAREGETLSSSDFVVDGVDYSLYKWVKEDGTVVDIQELIQNGLTENITATSTGELVSTNLTAQEGYKVNFYIFLDGKRVLLETRSVTAYTYTGKNRYYLSAATLESVYGDYGFTASQLTVGTKYFPHAEVGNNTIWADAAAEDLGGLCFSPILGTGKTANQVDVYYLPNQTVTDSSSYADCAVGESFYSVKVEDLANKVYTSEDIPATVYTRAGSTAVVTVQNADGVTWVCTGSNGSTVDGTTNDDGTTTFTIETISQPYIISPALAEGERLIIYSINLPQTPSDAEYGTPTIEGGSTCRVLETTETHTVLAPSLTSYFYSSEKYLGEATFLGWMVNGDESQLVQPGESLDLTLYEGNITLTANWFTKLGGTSNATGSMVNFFVSLEALPEGTTRWTGSTDTPKFTQSVYTTDCGVEAGTAKDKNLYASKNGSQYFVLGGTSGTDLNANHETITQKLTAGYTLTGNDDNSYTYRADFPTDEEVLLKIRQMVAGGTTITINGHTITVDELTTENFTIKWYVFKYDTTDSWHIDGILVAKTGKMVVTKTFAGDSDAIEGVKEGYSISVTGESGAVHEETTLTITDADSSDGSTFTWIVDVDQYYDYTVTENNYESDAALTTTTARYNVRNSNDESQNTNGWRTYSSGVTVTGRGYRLNDPERLTVSFLNTYTAPGTLILQKVDAATGNLMPNVSFTIGKVNDSSFGVYNTVGSHYTADPTGQTGSTVTTITTDASGQAYLYIGGGTYTFTEAVPTGYDDPGTITAVLEGDSENKYKVVTITSVSAINGEQFVEKDDLTLTVKNYSRTIDLTVKKIWEDGENKPVTIQLYRGGSSMGDTYQVTFDGRLDSKETEAWACTFTGLPLYADGGPAQYSIRETALGDFKYSDEYTDGYRYYDVIYSGMSYLDDTGSVTADMADVKKIELSVTNKRSTGELAIQKVDGNGNVLAGAVFKLYAAADEELPTVETLNNQTPVGTATSDANGRVTFGRMDAGEYYLIEESAPEGYVKSDEIYRLVFDGSSVAMYRLVESRWEQLSTNQVVNMRQTVSIEIEKQVTGSFGDLDREFTFNYSYTVEGTTVTGTFALKDDETTIIENIPVGAVLILTETGAEGYEISAVYGTSGSSQMATDGNMTFTINESDNRIVVTNNREVVPDTGILPNTLPCILNLAVVIVCGILYFRRRRNRCDD